MTNRTEKQRQQWAERQLKGDLMSLPRWARSVSFRFEKSTLSEQSKDKIRRAVEALSEACNSALTDHLTKDPK